VKLTFALNLNAEVIEPGLSSPRRDREIHPGIIEHPLRVIGLDHGRLRGEQCGVETDGLREILYRHVNVKALHDIFLASD
jgi:hypothetical protein